MATDERARHQLYQRLEQTPGPEPATTLMEHLPPTGWAQVATKADVRTEIGLVRSELVALEDRINLRFAQVDDRFGTSEQHLDERLQTLEYKLLAAFRGEMNAAITAQTRSFIMAMTTLFILFASFSLGLRIF